MVHVAQVGIAEDYGAPARHTCPVASAERRALVCLARDKVLRFTCHAAGGAYDTVRCSRLHGRQRIEFQLAE